MSHEDFAFENNWHLFPVNRLEVASLVAHLVKNLSCNVRDLGFDPWVGKITTQGEGKVTHS